MIYEIHPIEEGNLQAGIRVWNCAAQAYVLQLKDKDGLGMTLLIAMTFKNLQQQSQQRADDYMAGVLIGVTHCIVAGTPTIGFIRLN